MSFPMVRNAFAEVRRNPRRIVAVVVAIMISVGYLTASVTVLASESATMEKSVIARTSKADVVVTLTDGDSGLVERIRRIEGVTSADLSFLSHGRVTGSSEWVQQQSVPANPALRWTDIAEGAWPAGPDEIALGTITAKQLNLRIGDQITINDANSSATLQVTGLTHEGNSLLSGLAQSSFVAPEFYTGPASIRQSLQTEILVIGTADPQRLAERIRAVAGTNSVETSAAFAQRKMKDQAGGIFVFQLLLLVFGAIALLVGGIMIVNTFLILVAQRRRQIGLLRAVGASSAQIRRSLLAEALAIGVIGSVLGVLLGIAVSALVAQGIGEDLVLPMGQIGLVVAVGVIVAVLSVLVPARRATRISPLEALRPVADQRTERRSSRVRLVLAGVLMLVGLVAIWQGFGESPYALLLSVGGEFVFAVGLLAATGIYLPVMLRTSGALLGRMGPTARLAAANTIRNPGRAAATCAALILAVGIVVTLQVGAASMKATVSDNLETRFPVDVTVSMFDGPLPARARDDIAAITGIADATAVKSTRASVQLGSSTKDLRVLGPAAVSDNEVLADPYLLLDPTITEVGITGKSGAVRLPVKPNYLAPADTLIVSPAVLAKLDPEAVIGTIWAKALPGADITALRSQLRAVVAPITGAEVGGGLSAKASYNEFLDRLLLVTTMLLAVAVLIALIGVGNTLGLSVLERTRESALLRALGLQSRNLRAMLAIEAVLLSLSATAVGILSGIFFGWIGTHAISGELNFSTVTFALSIPQTLIVAAIATISGIAASIVPGQRAAKSAPVNALTED
ncbi:putative ABC transport system permease protein [Kibdelosporangium banguiense]|uniref:ABC transport system permease protein n=1 Tax=Kibdelosporangium banguiense TaxID=1365924 RepID=A0ABS4T6C6_9PSEU|nr:FtsX-like permease family protein [Kibdelosporangium banguiense]MBP2319977.1 putative ABC transport system permease protein [Kibdelosporangium banguiense]